MLDLLGWGEWILIALLAFVIVGPEELPSLCYKFAKLLRRLSQMTEGVRQEFDGLMRLEALKELPLEQSPSGEDPSHVPSKPSSSRPRRHPKSMQGGEAPVRRRHKGRTLS